MEMTTLPKIFVWQHKSQSVYLNLIRLLDFGCCIIDSRHKMSNKVIPVVRAEEEEEEEVVDPQTQLREECGQKPDAQNLWAKYQECNDRVNSRSNTAETCEEELRDYLHVLDHCVTKDLFKRLK
ncbi:cytochrome b-c1 complex subunit 6, mitochondrial [Melitaea cinxia]|uniref:cytochrome b-c1 complex subunit 6, mitochondrial n=1 Tax=Melitaea cinxia TaxID=113334 RepID=UPI001E26F611|nr:cytochrome b-c1 complex subunit 6, mitochondrial [Melitaea cinxia]